MTYAAPDLLALNGAQLCQGGRTIFAQELEGLIGSALNYVSLCEGEEKIRLAPGRLWNEMPI